MNGKGAKPRPMKVDSKTWSTNWKKAFEKSKKNKKSK